MSKPIRMLTQEMPDGSTRFIDISPAYDKRDEGYGIHGCEIRFGIKKNGSAIVLLWMLPLFLPETREYLDGHHLGRLRNFDGLGSIDYHSPTQVYEGQEPISNCPYIECACYCDGSGLQAGKIFDKFTADPTELWLELERWMTNLEEDQRSFKGEE